MLYCWSFKGISSCALFTLHLFPIISTSDLTSDQRLDFVAQRRLDVVVYWLRQTSYSLGIEIDSEKIETIDEKSMIGCHRDW